MTAKTSRPRTTRGVPHTYSYGLGLRLTDRLAGWNDRRIVQQHGGDHNGDQPTSTAWISRVQATFDELDHQLLAKTRDEARIPVRTLHELTGAMQALAVQIAEAEAEVTTQRDQKVSTDRNGGESHLSDDAVGVRRTRDRQAAIGRAEGRLQSLVHQFHEAGHEAARVRADIVERFELACENSIRLEHYYNRRIGTYSRLARLTAPGPTVTPAACARGSCPWLPTAEAKRPVPEAQPVPHPVY